MAPSIKQAAVFIGGRISDVVVYSIIVGLSCAVPFILPYSSSHYHCNKITKIISQSANKDEISDNGTYIVWQIGKSSQHIMACINKERHNRTITDG